MVGETMVNSKTSEADAVRDIFANYDACLFDCDGTLYHAGTILPYVKEAIEHLRSMGKKVFFVTNTSSRSSEQLQKKLIKMGVPCEARECVPSGVFTAAYVKRTHPEAKRVYVIGGQGLVDELKKVGIDSSGGPSEDTAVFQDTEFEDMARKIEAERYDGVVVGWDTALNYYKIVKSSLVFQKHPDCFFYATNDDLADRVGTCLLPGNGCLLPTIESSCSACATQRQDKAAPFGTKAVSLGKPNPAYARLIAEWNGIDLKRACMFGDRLDTDIEMANRAGMGSCFVLTGVDDLAQVAAKGIAPTHILPQVGSLWSERSAL
eukprot:TRINITY_DN15946_c0_g3_i1.p1 TRINITY_DN15946_c0_g3~~TRINITY_DN15946_c0_g3_i1.p1  ORF type:complete len:320 (+),score=44.27 TRINITY_DN15946_c0_g3_i1:103-1062(+)